MIHVNERQLSFYREFLMARASFKPQDFGIDMDRAQFDDLLVEEFHGAFTWAFDEFLLHPREVLGFCDAVRRKHGFYDLPDDIILRTIMTRRKNPNA